MNDDSKKKKSANGAAPPGQETGGVVTMKCADIQEILFDYMSRELGEAQSALVREHLRKCPDCQASAAEMQSAIELLKKASSAPTYAPTRLSEDHRKRIFRAISHPVIDWIERHHTLVAVGAALIFMILVWIVMRRIELLRFAEQDDSPGFSVSLTTEGTNILDETKEIELNN